MRTLLALALAGCATAPAPRAPAPLLDAPSGLRDVRIETHDRIE